jgi:hypothetical protein
VLSLYIAIGRALPPSLYFSPAIHPQFANRAVSFGEISDFQDI